MRRHAPPEKTLAFFTHEVRGLVYKWRPVFSGLRTWCWKRLLVKNFLHSFGKITTRTKTLLSLYQNVDDVKNSKIKDLLRAANKATVDKIGDPRYRERWLPKECKETNGMAIQRQHAALVHNSCSLMLSKRVHLYREKQRLSRSTASRVLPRK